MASWAFFQCDNACFVVYPSICHFVRQPAKLDNLRKLIKNMSEDTCSSILLCIFTEVVTITY